MKKLKLLPTMLMLVLCVGVLAIGVFALAPTQNTISGTITINAANSPVEITMNIKNKAGGDLIGTPKTIRGGHTFTLGDLAFDTASANEVYDVKDIFIEFYIKNLADASDVLTEKQERTIGAFFAESSVTLGDNERATSEDIFTYGSITEGETTYVNIYADSYTPILPQETVKIELQLRMESFEELDKSPLNYKLFIEPYVAETTDDGLQKLPVTSTLSTVSNGDIASGATHVAIPATYDTLGADRKCTTFENAASTLVGVNIPASINRYDNNNSGYGVFENCVGIKKVVLVGTDFWYVNFAGCSSLASVTIPSGATTIGAGMFENCTSLTKLVLPSSLTQIGSGAFKGCTGLSMLELPSSLTQIESGTFEGCTGLSMLELPSSLTQIGGDAFKGCTGLSMLELPSSLTQIESDAFEGCTSLHCTVENGLIYLGSKNNAYFACVGAESSEFTKLIFNSNTKVIIDYYNWASEYNAGGLTDIIIPEGVTRFRSIVTSAVYESVVNISVPDSMERLDVYLTMFPNLQTTNYNGIKYLGNEVNPYVAAVGVDGNTASFHNDTRAIANVRGCTSWKNNKIIIPRSVRGITSSAFANCKFEYMYIPNNIINLEGIGKVTLLTDGKIYVEHESRPETWDSEWTSITSVEWGHDMSSIYGSN